MKNWTFAILIALVSPVLHAENNRNATSIDNNTTNQKQLAKHVKEELRLEEHYSKTQAFEQGKDYNLSIHKVDPKDLETIPVIEPEYDFNMDDVYD